MSRLCGWKNIFSDRQNSVFRPVPIWKLFVYFCPSNILSMRLHTTITFVVMILVSGMLVSCGEKKPEGILSKREIIPVMKDMQIAYAGIDATVKNDLARPKRYAEMNAQILKKYKVNKEVFYKSYKYYQSRPVMMDSIYTKIIEMLNEEMVPLQQKQRRNKANKVPEAK